MGRINGANALRALGLNERNEGNPTIRLFDCF